MDQGVIQNLKVNYRKHLFRWGISQIETGKNYKLALLDTLHLRRRSWEQVSKETIRNCFRHAKFIHRELSNAEEGAGDFRHEKDGDGADKAVDEAMDEFLNAWTDLLQLGGIDTDVAIQDYIDVDDLTTTSGALTLAEIVEDVSRSNIDADEDSDTDFFNAEEVEVEKPSISRIEAQRGFAIARQYVGENSSDPAVLRFTDGIDNFYWIREHRPTAEKNSNNIFIQISLLFTQT